MAEGQTQYSLSFFYMVVDCEKYGVFWLYRYVGRVSTTLIINPQQKKERTNTMKTIDSTTLRNTYAALLLKEHSLLLASDHGFAVTSETGDTVFAFTEDDNHKWSVRGIVVDGEEVDSSCLELDTMLEVSIALLRALVYSMEKCYVDMNEKLPEEYAPGEVKAATIEGFNLEMELDGKGSGLATA